MDLSKLPRLSKTEGQAPGTDAPPDAHPAPIAVVYQEPGIGLEMWITVVLTMLFLALGRQYVSYSIAMMRHQPYHTNATWQEGAKAGQEVPYPELDASFGLPYWSDSSMFYFGVALLLSAVALAMSALRLRGSRAACSVALAAILAAILYNLFVAVKLIGVNITPLLQLVCIGLGGYEGYLQLRVLRGPRPANRRSQGLLKEIEP